MGSFKITDEVRNATLDLDTFRTMMDRGPDAKNKGYVRLTMTQGQLALETICNRNFYAPHVDNLSQEHNNELRNKFVASITAAAVGKSTNKVKAFLSEIASGVLGDVGKASNDVGFLFLHVRGRVKRTEISDVLKRFDVKFSTKKGREDLLGDFAAKYKGNLGERAIKELVDSFIRKNEGRLSDFGQNSVADFHALMSELESEIDSKKSGGSVGGAPEHPHEVNLAEVNPQPAEAEGPKPEQSKEEPAVPVEPAVPKERKHVEVKNGDGSMKDDLDLQVQRHKQGFDDVQMSRPKEADDCGGRKVDFDVKSNELYLVSQLEKEIDTLVGNAVKDSGLDNADKVKQDIVQELAQVKESLVGSVKNGTVTRFEGLDFSMVKQVIADAVERRQDEAIMKLREAILDKLDGFYCERGGFRNFSCTGTFVQKTSKLETVIKEKAVRWLGQNGLSKEVKDQDWAQHWVDAFNTACSKYRSEKMVAIKNVVAPGEDQVSRMLDFCGKKEVPRNKANVLKNRDSILDGVDKDLKSINDHADNVSKALMDKIGGNFKSMKDDFIGPELDKLFKEMPKEYEIDGERYTIDEEDVNTIRNELDGDTHIQHELKNFTNQRKPFVIADCVDRAPGRHEGDGLSLAKGRIATLAQKIIGEKKRVADEKKRMDEIKKRLSKFVGIRSKNEAERMKGVLSNLKTKVEAMKAKEGDVKARENARGTCNRSIELQFDLQVKAAKEAALRKYARQKSGLELSDKDVKDLLDGQKQLGRDLLVLFSYDETSSGTRRQLEAKLEKLRQPLVDEFVGKVDRNNELDLDGFLDRVKEFDQQAVLEYRKSLDLGYGMLLDGGKAPSKAVGKDFHSNLDSALEKIVAARRKALVENVGEEVRKAQRKAVSEMVSAMLWPKEMSSAQWSMQSEWLQKALSDNEAAANAQSGDDALSKFIRENVMETVYARVEREMVNRQVSFDQALQEVRFKLLAERVDVGGSTVVRNNDLLALLRTEVMEPVESVFGAFMKAGSFKTVGKLPGRVAQMLLNGFTTTATGKTVRGVGSLFKDVVSGEDSQDKSDIRKTVQELFEALLAESKELGLSEKTTVAAMKAAMAKFGYGPSVA